MTEADMHPYCDANGEPDPRLAPDLLGHGDAQALLLGALRHASLPHAWLITGTRGIGKAVLAWQFARVLLHHGTKAQASQLEGFQVPHDSQAAKLVANGAHPDLCHIHPAWDARQRQYKRQLGVDAIRQAKRFFGLSSGLAGWRVCLLDCADDLSPAAANALLKILEEPPPHAIFLIICDQPGRILPTIRSRCQRLHLANLAVADIVKILGWYHPNMPASEQELLAQLGQGSAGQALSFAQDTQLALYQTLLASLEALPELPYEQIATLTDMLSPAGTGGAATPFIRFGDLLLGVLQRIVLYGLGRPQAILDGEKKLAKQFCAHAPVLQLSAAWETIARETSRARRLNLDGAQAVSNCFATLAQTLR